MSQNSGVTSSISDLPVSEKPSSGLQKIEQQVISSLPDFFQKWSPRAQAFAAHFFFSFILFIILLTILITSWFPSFLFHSDGGWEALQLLIGVDLILGPLLTLIVFKEGKKGLKLDLTLIVLFQISCLVIGLYIIYQERPLAVVFSDDRFIAISQGTFDFAGTDSSALDEYPNTYPKLIYIRMPEDSEARKSLRKQQINEGPLHGRPTFFEPYEDNAHRVASQGGININEITAQNPNRAEAITQWHQQKYDSSDQVVWIPYHGRYRSTYLVVERNSGKILTQIPNRINPKDQ